MATIDKISPPGYHVLTLSEIGLIQTALGVDAGGKMKTEGFEHWDDPNTGATNESGFSAVGCGKRDWNTGLFSGQRKQAMLWAADEYDTDNAGAYTLANGNALLGVAEQWNKGEGLSVRLAMDNPALFTPGMTVNDADGNTYNLVKIPISVGVDIVVTVENLRTTKYANGDPIVLAQPNNDWINAVGGAYCTFDPAPPQHALLVTSTPFKVQTKAAGGISPTIGTNFIKALHMVATTKALTTSLKTVELRKGKILSAVSGAFTTSLKSTGFVKALNMGATVKSLSLSMKTAILTAGTTYPIVYIDPENTESGRDGTIENPYNSFSEFTMQSDYTYLVKNGSQWTSSTQLSINWLSNVVVSTYGLGDRPKFTYTGSGDYAIRINNCINTRLIGFEVLTPKTNSVTCLIAPESGYGNEISDCIIHDVRQLSGANGMGIRGDGDNLKIVDCEIYNCGVDGIYLANTTNLEIGNCNIHHVNQDYGGFSQGFRSIGVGASGDGIQLDGLWTNFRIHHTIIDRSDPYTGNKFPLILNSADGRNDASGGIVENCTFTTRAGASIPCSIYIAQGNGVTIRYNSFVGITGGVRISNSATLVNSCKNTLIHHNIFYDCTYGVGVSYGNTALDNRNTKSYNNTFYNVAMHHYVDKSFIDSRNNVHLRSSGSDVAIFNYGSGTWNIQNNCYGDSLTVGTPGAGSGAIIGDPKFVDAPNNDFHLQSDSPCIETALSMGIDFDFDGVSIPQGSAPCIGAYEFVPL